MNNPPSKPSIKQKTINPNRSSILQNSEKSDSMIQSEIISLSHPSNNKIKLNIQKIKSPLN